MSDEYLNSEQAAEFLEVNRSRIYELAKAGRLGRRVAGFLLFTREELHAYKDSKGNRKGGRPPKKISAPTM
jgi:predicted DNA-binding transcriptional regulator AlpA